MVKTIQELLPVIGNTTVIYLFLLAMLSLMGHRATSELVISEIVVVMVLGSAVETSLIAGDKSLLAGITSATTLMILNRIMSLVFQRRKMLRRLILGEPIPLVDNGRILPDQARRAGLTEDDILQGIRERGYERLDQVHYAILETDGNISVIPKEKGKKQ